MSHKFGISVIMPALNEEENIRDAVTNTLKAFVNLSINGEVVVINDGSTDKTKDIVNEIIKNDDRVKLVNHTTPHGVGKSFWDGVDHSTKEVVSMFPGDNENDPWETLRYFDLLDHVDIVVPFVFNKEARPFFRNVLSYVYRFIINATFHVNLNYTNGTVLYRKAILGDVNNRSSGFFYQTDILIRLLNKSYLFAEVPYRLGVRKGLSKAVSFPSLLQVMRGYLRLVRDMKISKSGGKKFPFKSITSKRYGRVEPPKLL